LQLPVKGHGLVDFLEIELAALVTVAMGMIKVSMQACFSSSYR